MTLYACKLPSLSPRGRSLSTRNPNGTKDNNETDFVQNDVLRIYIKKVPQTKKEEVTFKDRARPVESQCDTNLYILS